MAVSPSEEELDLIRDFAILPIMLDLCETQLRKLEYSSISLKKLYVVATQKLMEIIHADLVRVKKTLREHQIKVVEEPQQEASLQYRFFCRGYQDSFGLMKEVVKAEMSVRLPQYMVRLWQSVNTIRS